MGKISLRNVSKKFGEVAVIPSLDLDIENGEFVVFVGPSGCGKSTLLRLIAGLEDTSGGVILIDGVDATDTPPAKRGLAMVFQSYALYPHMSVRKNIAFPLKMAGLPPAEIDRKVDGAAKVLNLTSYLDRKPGQLSGGQRQRVAIGRAIVREPKAFLFDEPLSNLDAALRVQTRLEIAKLHHSMSDVTMIYVTHDQVEAMTLADRIAVLRDGKLEQVGSPAELYERPNSLFVAGFIGSPKMNFLTGKFASDHGCTTLGVRSEHLDVVAGGGIWQGEIVHAEDLGSDHYLFVEVGSDEPLIVRREGKLTMKVGDHVNLAAKDGKLYKFDAQGVPMR